MLSRPRPASVTYRPASAQRQQLHVRRANGLPPQSRDRMAIIFGAPQRSPTCARSFSTIASGLAWRVRLLQYTPCSRPSLSATGSGRRLWPMQSPWKRGIEKSVPKLRACSCGGIAITSSFGYNDGRSDTPDWAGTQPPRFRACRSLACRTPRRGRRRLPERDEAGVRTKTRQSAP